MSDRNGSDRRKNPEPTFFFIGNVVKYEQYKALKHKLHGGDPMTGWIIVGFFTSFGILCAGVVLYGLILFRRLEGTGGWLLIPCQEQEYADYYRWLRSVGVLRCRIIPWESGECPLWQEEHKENQPGAPNPDQ